MQRPYSLIRKQYMSTNQTIRPIIFSHGGLNNQHQLHYLNLVIVKNIDAKVAESVENLC